MKKNMLQESVADSPAACLARWERRSLCLTRLTRNTNRHISAGVAAANTPSSVHARPERGERPNSGPSRTHAPMSPRPWRATNGKAPSGQRPAQKQQHHKSCRACQQCAHSGNLLHGKAHPGADPHHSQQVHHIDQPAGQCVQQHAAHKAAAYTPIGWLECQQERRNADKQPAEQTDLRGPPGG